MEKETERIWKDFHRGLHAFVARRVNNPADANEILQEIFLRIHRHLPSVRNPGRLTSWVFQVTRNTLVDYYRVAARRNEVPSGLADEMVGQRILERQGSEHNSAANRRELASCLGPMIERLPDLYREAVTLVELQGMTEHEAAKRLGLSVSGMKSRVQRGRRKLREMLEACCQIELDRRKGIVSYEVRGPSCRSCEPDGPNDQKESKIDRRLQR